MEKIILRKLIMLFFFLLTFFCFFEPLGNATTSGRNEKPFSFDKLL